MEAPQERHHMAEDEEAYDTYIETMRQKEYPMLKNSIYLDHAAASLPNKTTLDAYHAEMMKVLCGNTHSASSASQQAGSKISDVRLELLRFFNASPDTFDLVFTANTSAGIKLVAESLRDLPGGFDFGYHEDAHTSVVGVRELAQDSVCVQETTEMLTWHRDAAFRRTRLFAYPAQSNMNGRRLPLSWCKQMSSSGIYTMLDAAGYAPVSRLDLDQTLPDFTVLSLSKIFGFSDLGALIVRKDCAHLLRHRKYFGGGTVDMVVCRSEQWHIKRAGAIHEQLEDGSLPTHSILAAKLAMSAHTELFGTLDRVAKHTMFLARRLHSELQALKHANGRTVASIYTAGPSAFDNAAEQGPTVAFNLRDRHGQWVSNHEVEKLASVRDIQLRTGSICNPGGVATALALEPWEMRQNYQAGFRCGGENDVLHGKPTGVIRVSLGAMSTLRDVQHFLDFINEYFVESDLSNDEDMMQPTIVPALQVECLTVYPIKSCAGWLVPLGVTWDIRPQGLAWDREWCIVHQGTGAALSQKAYPRMALIRPELDFQKGQLRIKLSGSEDLEVPLSLDPGHLDHQASELYCTTVCEDTIEARRYVSSKLAEQLSAFLGVSCTLARFPPHNGAATSARHRKTHMQGSKTDAAVHPLLLSNESPILTITRSSLNALNEVLKAKGRRAVHHSVFRANIILAESSQHRPGSEQPWVEDQWELMNVRSPDGSRAAKLANLGSCRRCQMVCIDQLTGERRNEIFLTLAKHRRIDGRVLFGIHTALQQDSHGRIQVGDVVDLPAAS